MCSYLPSAATEKIDSMERDLLERWLAEGLSLAEIGRRVDRNPSTVAYWLKRYGLEANGRANYAPKGEVDRHELEALAASGATLAEMAATLDRSIATVRYWLRRWEIARTRRPGRTPEDPTTAPPIAEMRCAQHGHTRFRLEGRGSYRCMRCRQERVAEWRRRVKRLLVAEAGGSCRLCGYARCVAALQFHHLDPTEKRFALSRRGVTRSLDEARHEARKCVLLCANCHAEVETGYRSLDPDAMTTG